MVTTNVSPGHAKDTLMKVVNRLSSECVSQVLDFALSIEARQARQHRYDNTVPPVQRLEDLWGDFWPKDESVDDFIHAVRQWRREDAALHEDLQ